MKNLPWLINSRKVLIAGFLEILVITIFSILKINNFTISSFYLLFFLVWTFSSYIIGRYSDSNKSNSVSFFSEFTKLISTFFISSLITLVITSYSNSIIFNYDKIYSIILFILSSFIIQYLFKVKYKLNKIKYLNWLVLAEENEIKQLKKYLKESRIPQKLNKLNLDKHNLQFIKSKYIGIIISNENLITEADFTKLKKFDVNGLQIKSKISWCENVMQRIPGELIKGSEILSKDFLKNPNRLMHIIKRAGDISLSILLLILTSPILLISSILIWLTDRGPIFYSQIRSGYRGKTFRVWKLRSMQVNAEKDSNPIWASKNDPRITKVGAILRKSRIDELPQLINVINGSMSLIGPRPERPEIEKTLTKKIKNYEIKNYVKPGLSGWAQVNYPYGASILDSKIKISFDIFYIKNQSTLLDILILLKTIRMVFNLKGSEPLEQNNN